MPPTNPKSSLRAAKRFLKRAHELIQDAEHCAEDSGEDRVVASVKELIGTSGETLMRVGCAIDRRGDNANG